MFFVISWQNKCLKVKLIFCKIANILRKLLKKNKSKKFPVAFESASKNKKIIKEKQRFFGVTLTKIAVDT